MKQRERVREAGAAIEDGPERARWVVGLSLVLDDEPLIALDRATGHGFRLTMSGVGDNYQLQTLLADRLIGEGLVAGQAPLDQWVAAATDASPRLPMTNPVYQRLRLSDGHGGYVYPEGRPWDIPLLDGVRVIVLDPPRGAYGWSAGRVFTQMLPALTVDGTMSPDEAAHWMSRIAPAREE